MNIKLKKSLFDYPEKMVNNILKQTKHSILNFFESFAYRIKRGELARENMYLEMIELDVREIILEELRNYYKIPYDDEIIQEFEEFLDNSDEFDHYRYEFFKKYNNQLKEFENQLLKDINGKYAEADTYFKAVFKESGLNGHRTSAPKRRAPAKKCPVKVDFRRMI